jgi:hypothetical protein
MFAASLQGSGLGVIVTLGEGAGVGTGLGLGLSVGAGVVVGLGLGLGLRPGLVGLVAGVVLGAGVALGAGGGVPELPPVTESPCPGRFWTIAESGLLATYSQIVTVASATIRIATATQVMRLHPAPPRALPVFSSAIALMAFVSSDVSGAPLRRIALTFAFARSAERRTSRSVHHAMLALATLPAMRPMNVPATPRYEVPNAASTVPQAPLTMAGICLRNFSGFVSSAVSVTGH